MGERSVIEWTDSTWNPWRGCDKVSPGCDECYMFRDQKRYGRDPEVVTRCAPGTFFAPVRSKKWAAERDRHLAEKGRHLVFSCSWSDFFHPAADDWREEAWQVIRETPESTYQILTKRPRLIPTRLPADWGDGYPNVWLGVSVESAKWIYRADLLRAVPAAARFISAEPLLGPLVPIYNSGSDAECGDCEMGPAKWEWEDDFFCGECVEDRGLNLSGIHWLITGGESGGRPDRQLVVRHPGKRGAPWLPKEGALIWVRDLRETCESRGVAFLHKQWGGPQSESGGRLLDGRTYDEFPAVAA